MSTSRASRLTGVGSLSLLVFTMILLSVASVGRADETVQVCGSYANQVFARTPPVKGITVKGTCPNPPLTANGFALYSSGTSTRGVSAHWQATAPTGLAIVGASTNSMVSAGLNSHGGDFGGGFYWSGGGAQTHDSETSAGFGPIFSSYFGFQLVCGVSNCTQPAQLDIGAISLYVRETSGPSFVAPTGLWQSSGWIRGTWPFFAWGNSPSGLCSLSAQPQWAADQHDDVGAGRLDLASVRGAADQPVGRHDSVRPGRACRSRLSTSDAAGVPASLSKTVYVDNSTPTISLSGPVDAPSTAGTQYVTATAGGSPSGIADIVCSVDGGPAQSYSGGSAQVPVSGIGTHTVSCYAQDNAVDPSGAHGQSSTATWSLKIGQPTVVGIAFDKLVGLRCHRRARAREGSRALDHRSPSRQAREGQDAGAHAGRAGDALPSAHGTTAHRGVRARASSRPLGQGQADQGGARGGASACHRQDVASRCLRARNDRQRVSGHLRRDRDRRSRRERPDRARQRRRAVHPGGCRDNCRERDVDRDAAARTVADRRGGLRRRPDDGGRFLRAGPRDRAGQGEAAQRLADAWRGAGPCGSPGSCSAGTCRPAERWCGCGSGRGAAIRPTVCRST